MLGVGAKHIQDLPTPPPTAASVISFASIVCIAVFAWCTMTPDYGVYHAPVPRYVPTVTPGDD